MKCTAGGALRSTRRTASNRAGLHDNTRVAKDVAYEFLWQANDITPDELKNSVVKEEAERDARRYYYVIVLPASTRPF